MISLVLSARTEKLLFRLVPGKFVDLCEETGAGSGPRYTFKDIADCVVVEEGSPVSSLRPTISPRSVMPENDSSSVLGLFRTS